MFGIGFFELLVIAVVALIFVGPKKLPEVMKQAGKFFVHMRRTANDVRGTFDQVVREAEEEVRRDETEQLKKLLTTGPQTPTTPSTAVDNNDLTAGLPVDPHAQQHGHAAGHDVHHPAAPAPTTNFQDPPAPATTSKNGT